MVDASSSFFLYFLVHTTSLGDYHSPPREHKSFFKAQYLASLFIFYIISHLRQPPPFTMPYLFFYLSIFNKNVFFFIIIIDVFIMFGLLFIASYIN